MKRPCIACGTPIERSSRCRACTPKRAPRATAHAGTDKRWRNLSTAQRKKVPFCELRLPGCTGQPDTADHLLPVSEYPQYAHEPLNLRTACRRCNAARGNRYTEAEREQLLTTITARKQRAANYYRTELAKAKQASL